MLTINFPTIQESIIIHEDISIESSDLLDEYNNVYRLCLSNFNDNCLDEYEKLDTLFRKAIKHYADIVLEGNVIEDFNDTIEEIVFSTDNLLVKFYNSVLTRDYFGGYVLYEIETSIENVSFVTKRKPHANKTTKSKRKTTYKK